MAPSVRRTGRKEAQPASRGSVSRRNDAAKLSGARRGAVKGRKSATPEAEPGVVKGRGKYGGVKGRKERQKSKGFPDAKDAKLKKKTIKHRAKEQMKNNERRRKHRRNKRHVENKNKRQKDQMKRRKTKKNSAEKSKKRHSDEPCIFPECNIMWNKEFGGEGIQLESDLKDQEVAHAGTDPPFTKEDISDPYLKETAAKIKEAYKNMTEARDKRWEEEQKVRDEWKKQYDKEKWELEHRNTTTSPAPTTAAKAPAATKPPPPPANGAPANGAPANGAPANGAPAGPANPPASARKDVSRAKREKSRLQSGSKRRAKEEVSTDFISQSFIIHTITIDQLLNQLINQSLSVLQSSSHLFYYYKSINE